jgi:hypothetical protein
MGLICRESENRGARLEQSKAASHMSKECSFRSESIRVCTETELSHRHSVATPRPHWGDIGDSRPRSGAVGKRRCKSLNAANMSMNEGSGGNALRPSLDLNPPWPWSTLVAPPKANTACSALLQLAPLRLQRDFRGYTRILPNRHIIASYHMSR